MAINFHIEPPLQYKLQERMQLRSWLKQVAETHGHRMGELNIILCTDDYLHDMNLQYLQHDTLTDVITFDNSEQEGRIEGDIFISVERVKDNAAQFGTDPSHELRRVMVHGTLHLIGYGDKSEDEQAQMRQKENEWLDKYDAMPKK